MKLLIYIFFLLTFLFTNNTIAQSHNWERTNPGGGGAFSTIEAGPPTSNGAMQIIAGSDLSGAYYSWDNGQSWEVYGANEGLFSTHVSGIGFHPFNAEIFFLGVDGGIFKSKDGGGYLYNVLDHGYVTDIEVSSINTKTVYAAYHSMYNTSDGSIYKSNDGGETFKKVSNNTLKGVHILEVLAHPLDSNIIYLLSGDGRFAKGPAAAYRSIDGGINWKKLTPSFDDVMHIAISGNTLYLSTMSPITENGSCIKGNNGKLYKSINSGDNWENDPIANLTGVIFINFKHPNIIRLIDPRCPYYWYNDSGTWTSIDSGESWSHTGFTDNWNTGYNEADSPQWSYGIGYNGISKTLGGSKTDPDAIFWTNIQWTFGSFDGGNNFKPLHTKKIGAGWQSTGIDNVVMLDISSNSSNPNEIYLGFADIGLWRSTDGGKSWVSSNPPQYTGNWQGFGGNCHSVLADPDISGRVWVSLQGDDDENVSLLYSTESGDINSWKKLGNGIPANTSKLMGLSLDENSPINNRILFASVKGDIFRSKNNGNDWDKVLSNGKLYLTSVDKHKGQIVYAGGADGLYLSINGGDNWSQIINPPSESNESNSDIYSEEYIGISSLDPDPKITNSLFFSYYGEASNFGGIYKWDGNTSIRLYTNPYLRCVKANPKNPNQIYAGSSYSYYQGFYNNQSEGVLYSSDKGATWTKVNEEMSWHFAVCMEIVEDDHPRIFVGNTGSGFQVSDIPNKTETNNLINSSQIKIYPNPFTNKVTLETNFSNYKIIIFNTIGDKIVDYMSSNNIKTIDLSFLKAGLYFISIKDESSLEKYSFKFIKQSNK